MPGLFKLTKLEPSRQSLGRDKVDFARARSRMAHPPRRIFEDVSSETLVLHNLRDLGAPAWPRRPLEAPGGPGGSDAA